MSKKDMQQKETLQKNSTVIFCGMCMGAADLVPGISGGTIAFIMGFYQKLLSSITSFKMGKFCPSSVKFLGCLLAGIALSFILLVPFFDQILNNESYRPFLYSGFFGLIVGSIALIISQIEKWKLHYSAALLTGMLLAFVLTGLDLKPLSNEALFDVPVSFETTKIISNYDSEMLRNVPKSTVIAMLSKNILSKETTLYQAQNSILAKDLTGSETPWFKIDLWLIFCGAIAVTALLLPGISGSYLLTILGCYSTVIGALADFIASAKQLSFDAESFSILANVGTGIILGAAIFSRVVLFLLSHYRNLTITLMTGFMIGALPAVWPFWSYTFFLNPLKLEKGVLLNPQSPILPNLDFSFALCSILAVFGFSLVMLLSQKAKTLSKQT